MKPKLFLILFIVCWVTVVGMRELSVLAQVYLPMPGPPRMQFLDSSGNPVNAGKLHSFVTGTSTPLATYTDSTGATTNANPTVLDSAGRATIFLSSSVSYRFRLDTSADVTVWGPIDGVRVAAVDSILGTANQVTASASVGTVTLSLAGPHNFTTLTQYGALYGNGTGVVSATAVGSTSMVLTTSGGVAPSFSSNPTINSVVLNGVLLANIGTATAGTIKFCSNCTASGFAVCVTGGTGALAYGNGTSWMC